MAANETPDILPNPIESTARQEKPSTTKAWNVAGSAGPRHNLGKHADNEKYAPPEGPSEMCAEPHGTDKHHPAETTPKKSDRDQCASNQQRPCFTSVKAMMSPESSAA
jgi:hypothetical protein